MSKSTIWIIIIGIIIIGTLFYIFQKNNQIDYSSNYTTEKLSYTNNSINSIEENLIKNNNSETLISEYSTDILSEDSNRLNNLQIAALQLNGTIVESQKEFSFCDTLGPAKESDGYKKADILNSDGTKGKGIGGR